MAKVGLRSCDEIDKIAYFTVRWKTRASFVYRTRNMKKYCRKFQPPEYGARTLQTYRQQTDRHVRVKTNETAW